MIKYIGWKPFTWFTGRNGTFNCSGLEISAGHESVIFTPITGKGKAANSGFAIPSSSLEKLIVHLEGIRKEMGYE